jgi:hypothetical protein
VVDVLDRQVELVLGFRCRRTRCRDRLARATIEQPAWGQVRVSEALKRRGLSISPAGVRCVWQRHDLTSMKLRLKALEAKAAQEGVLLTEQAWLTLPSCLANSSSPTFTRIIFCSWVIS